MTQKKENSTTYKVGDEIWWFQINQGKDNGLNYGYHKALNPGELDLIHDQVREISDNVLICWHCAKRKDEVWGKTRQEAWDRLKSEISKWGELE